MPASEPDYFSFQVRQNLMFGVHLLALVAAVQRMNILVPWQSMEVENLVCHYMHALLKLKGMRYAVCFNVSFLLFFSLC